MRVAPNGPPIAISRFNSAKEVTFGKMCHYFHLLAHYFHSLAHAVRPATRLFILFRAWKSGLFRPWMVAALTIVAACRDGRERHSALNESHGRLLDLRIDEPRARICSRVSRAHDNEKPVLGHQGNATGCFRHRPRWSTAGTDGWPACRRRQCSAPRMTSAHHTSGGNRAALHRATSVPLPPRCGRLLVVHRAIAGPAHAADGWCYRPKQAT